MYIVKSDYLLLSGVGQFYRGQKISSAQMKLYSNATVLINEGLVEEVDEQKKPARKGKGKQPTGNGTGGGTGDGLGGGTGDGLGDGTGDGLGDGTGDGLGGGTGDGLGGGTGDGLGDGTGDGLGGGTGDGLGGGTGDGDDEL